MPARSSRVHGFSGLVHCGQRLGKAWIGQPGKHAGRYPAALDDVSHDQDQEIVEQPVERRLAATSFGECFADQHIADRRQRWMRRERQDHEFGQALPDRVALSAAEFDGRTNEIGAAAGINCETVDSATREKQEGWLIELEIDLASLGDRERASLEKVQVAFIGELRLLAKIAGEEGSGPRQCS